MRESGRPDHRELREGVLTPSPFTCLPNPPPYARMSPAFWRLLILRAGWQRVATHRPARSLLPGECGRYTSSPHSNLPESPWSNLRTLPGLAWFPPSRCSPARLPCRLLGSQGVMQPWAPDSYRRLAAAFCRAAHYAQECIKILWHRLEQPVNLVWYVGSTANAANTSSASW
jgi:hypothetical protein